MALFYIPADDLKRLEHDRDESCTPTIIDLLPSPPLNQLVGLPPRARRTVSNDAPPIKLYCLSSHLN